MDEIDNLRKQIKKLEDDIARSKYSKDTVFLIQELKEKKQDLAALLSSRPSQPDVIMGLLRQAQIVYMKADFPQVRSLLGRIENRPSEELTDEHVKIIQDIYRKLENGDIQASLVRQLRKSIANSDFIKGREIEKVIPQESHKISDQCRRSEEHTSELQ